MSHKTLHKHHSKHKDTSTLLFAAILLPIIVFVTVFAMLFMRGRVSQDSRQAVNSSHADQAEKQDYNSEEAIEDESFIGDTVEYQGEIINVPPPTL